MPTKGMSSVFVSPSRASPSPSHHSSSSSSPPMPRKTFSSSMIVENVDTAESIIRKWSLEEGSDSYCKLHSVFTTDRREGKDFLRSVKNIQSAMQFFVSEGSSSSSQQLVRAQNLMQIAMKRLEKEFYQILSSNRNNLDPESVSSRSSVSISDFEDAAASEEDDVIQVTGNSVNEIVAGDSVSELAMADLKAIADSMISSGYSKECVKIYKLVRKSILDENLYYLGVEMQLSLSQVQKLDWDAVEGKIKSWLNAVKTAVKTLFLGERILCDDVFSTSPKISESCFAEIARDNAVSLFLFPQLVAKYKKLSPEKMFRLLDLYDSITELWTEIELIFSFDSTSAVRSQAVNSLTKLGESIRAMLSDFETAIQKDGSQTPIQGGGVHPLTRYVMNYVGFLSDYSGTLSDIVSDSPQINTQSPLPESYFSSPTYDDGSTSPLSVRLAWLILVVLCKLDGKAKQYKDVALSYLFLANNLNYAVSKVRSSNLKLLLGDEWIENHEATVKLYAANYERMGWSKVMSSLPEENPTAEISPQEAREFFRRFNSGFEEAYKKQTSWVVSDPRLRDEIKVSLAKKLVPAYTSFYEKNRGFIGREAGVEPVVRYAPDDLGNYLSDLFYGTGASSGSVSSSVSSSGRKVR